MAWKNWGDHPIVVGIGVVGALSGLGYAVYDHHIKQEDTSKAGVTSPQPTTSASTSIPSPSFSPESGTLSPTLSGDRGKQTNGGGGSITINNGGTPPLTQQPPQPGSSQTTPQPPQPIPSDPSTGHSQPPNPNPQPLPNPTPPITPPPNPTPPVPLLSQLPNKEFVTIIGSYDKQEDAKKWGAKIKGENPDLDIQVFVPSKNSNYAVSALFSSSKEDAMVVCRTVRNKGIAKDAYVSSSSNPYMPCS